MKPREDLQTKEPVSVGINLFPGMDGHILEILAERNHALVLIGNALGGIADTLIPTIKKVTEAGTAVFVLTDNAGAGHGVIRIVDQPQVDAIKAGVTYLERANITNQAEVVTAIQEAVTKGLQGKDLAQYVEALFKYPEGEKPVSDLGTEEGLARFRARVDKEMGL